MSDLHEIGFFLVFCAGLVCCVWGPYKIWRTADIRRAGGLSAGTVVARRSNGEDSIITVSFLTAQQREMQFEQYSPPFFQRQEYTVFYNPAAPHRATVSPWADLLGGFLITVFGVLFLSQTYAGVLSL